MPVIFDRACTVTVEPSVSAVANDDIDPIVTTPGASKTGVVASAVDRPPSAVTRACRPGAGCDSALGRPTPEPAKIRNGYGGIRPGGYCGEARASSAPGLASRSPGSATEARAKVAGPLAMVA